MLAWLACGKAPALAGGQAPLGLREEVCRFCYRQCPISCFAGTCGVEYGTMIHRYEATSQCFSCEVSASMGASPTSELKLCSAKEAAATANHVRSPEAKRREGEKPKPKQPAGGPPLEGDPAAEVARATAMAAAAVQQLQAAAAIAARAGQMAAHMPHTAAPTAPPAAPAGAGGVTPAVVDDNMSTEEKIQAAQAHQLAAQIRASEALKVSEEAHKAWQLALKAYDEELPELRKEQLRVDVLEEAATRAEKVASKARQEYARLTAEAAQAAREELMTGNSAADEAVEQAKAEELQSSAQDAMRRLMAAAAEAAKTATAMSQPALLLQRTAKARSGHGALRRGGAPLTAGEGR